jgi:hypothetical protein
MIAGVKSDGRLSRDYDKLTARASFLLIQIKCTSWAWNYFSSGT